MQKSRIDGFQGFVVWMRTLQNVVCMKAGTGGVGEDTKAI